MNFLQIMQDVAKNAGIRIPSTTTSDDPDQVKLGQFINETGREIARRVDWSALRKTASFTGTGMASEFDIAPDFDRLVRGLSVMCGSAMVRGSLTPDEWFALEPVEGTSRYFHLRNNRISLYPYPKAGQSVRVQYQTRMWVTEVAAQDTDTMTKNEQETPLSGHLIVVGAVWRWRRHIGKDFADHMAEFEAMLADLAEADGGVRAP